MAANPRVLVSVDDDQQIVDVVTRMGEQSGYAAEGFTDPHAFLDSLREGSDPDVVVLDLEMPGVDGVEVLRSLADRRIGTDVIILTGLDTRTMQSAEGYASARGLKVLASMQKPFVPDELVAHLRGAGVAAAPLTIAELENALVTEQLIVHYQPTLRRFADGSWDVSAVESLLRWEHPGRGLLPPDAFIQLGEEHGLGGAMTDFVIQRSIQQLKGWSEQRLDLDLRINVSATLIADLAFPDRLAASLAQHEIDPSRVTLEITETAMLDRTADMFDIMTRLRVKNVNLAIDDFGIGYSSLTQLFAMPFNEMKIDKSLTQRIPESNEASIMVGALIDLAHKLHLGVCAEGVETGEALSFLSQAGCDSAQGFFVSRPVPAQAVPDVIARWSGRHHSKPSGDPGS